MTRIVVSPVTTVGGVNRTQVRFVQQDETTNEIFVQCYTSGGANPYAIAVAVFKANGGGVLDRSAQVDMDGSGTTAGWSGAPCNFGIAPGGRYIIVAQPLVTSPSPGIAVLDRTTLAHVQHVNHGEFHRSMAVSDDEAWAYTENGAYSITHNKVASLGSAGQDYPTFDAANNLWIGKGSSLSKYSLSWNGSAVVVALVGTYNPLGSVSIIGLSYMRATNLLSIFGNDGSIWLWDVATATIVRQAGSSFANHGVANDFNWTLPFNDYKQYFYDVYLTKATDNNFYFACPYNNTNVAVPFSTWGVTSLTFDTAAIWDRSQSNIWAQHNTSTGDPAFGIEILPYTPSIPAEPQPTLPPYNPGSPKRTRAWSYTMDGHTFYVLNLLDQGTFVYDTVTKQWSQFVTQGYDQWNMHNGVMWDKRPVGGDVATGQVYELDPEGVLDEGFRDISHTVTGGVQTRDRAYVSVSGLRVTGSPGALDEINGSSLLMRYSDDGGNTWSDFFSITLTESDFSADLLYPSLGSFNAPGRIFELSDTGGLIRIDGCDAMLNGFNNDKQTQE